jgi:hypothetical protein
MENQNMIPVGFDGVYRFTNFTENDFKVRWDGVEYTFPAMKTTPVIIATATPVQIQEIRKFFAKQLAILEFYKTPKFIGMNTVAPGGVPALYTDSDLTPFIQRCLEPLPVGQVEAKTLPKDSENNYKKDHKGKNVTRILDEDDSLLKEGAGLLDA